MEKKDSDEKVIPKKEEFEQLSEAEMAELQGQGSGGLSAVVDFLTSKGAYKCR